MTGQAKRLLAEITRVVEIMTRVRDRADALNEADTKAAFIDPILGVLGWEVRDPFTVSQQYRRRSQDNPVDYALLVMRSPVLFVEAKALNKDLSDYKWISQTLFYANAAGVEWCVLTNGDDYRIYNTFAKVEAEKKLFRRVKLSDREDRDLAIETLLLLSKETMAEKRIDVLWKAHFVDRRVREAIVSLFREPDAALVRLIVKRTQDLQPAEIRDSLRRGDLDLQFPKSLVTSPLACGLAESPAPFEPQRPASLRQGNRGKIVDLIAAGVIKPPVEIEVTFKSRRFTASIAADGMIRFNGASYSSLSHAGGMVRNEVNGPPPGGQPYWATNGWTFWRYKDPTSGQLMPLSSWLSQLPAGVPTD
jgi:predicted type IV restriction endonuclease